MRVTLFSPTHRRSAVARATADLVGAFRRRGDDVTVIVSEASAPARADRAPELGDAIDWRDVDLVTHHVDHADLVLHQLGDSFAAYAGGLFWLAKAGGCLILQDVSFADLVGGWAVTRPRQVAAFLRAGGVRGRLDGLRRSDVGEASVVEWLLPYADGVVAHSRFVRDALGDGVAAPVALLQPPVPPLPRAPQQAATEQPRSGDTTLRLLTAATVGPVGAADTVIHAIAADSALRAQVDYRIAAPMGRELRDYLESLAADLGVRLSVSGAIDDENLAAELQRADLVVAPRDRVTASVPAALVHAMRAGRAVIVPNDGYGAELAGELALGVERDDVVALTRVLRSVVAGEVDLAALGRRAAEFAGAGFDVDAYAQGIADLAPAAARHGAVRGLDQAFAPLLRWSGAEPAAVFERYVEDTAIFRP